MFFRLSQFICLLMLISALIGTPGFASDAALSLQDLGKALFFDNNLSANRTQSCATCHAPEAGFSDQRGLAGTNAASLGDDGVSLGDRNAPTAAYAALTPDFHRDASGVYRGGQFLDGRAANLQEQAAGPPLNLIEMGMRSEADVVARLQENPLYRDNFTALFGADIFKDAKAAYTAMTQAIAAFEQTRFFAPFDSRYDRHLRGEYKLTAQEELGMTLFFSQQFTNCNICHQLKKTPSAEGETFSNYEYHNIGVPVNAELRARNGVDKEFVDEGLLSHPQVDDPAQRGKFKTPTLRNIAVTAPYMHNGVFQDLRTVILFYNKYNSRSEKRQINPETGAKWADPEVAETISLEELETGPALDDKRIDALVAFMKTLTDQRYEHLLEEQEDPSTAKTAAGENR
ncbi:MAG: methylamine utilization protein MauG [Gammaproteobacteria bacterium]|nr:methylamine utilization protein MauG [Gammaproteobacteria bacterium]